MQTWLCCLTVLIWLSVANGDKCLEKVRPEHFINMASLSEMDDISLFLEIRYCDVNSTTQDICIRKTRALHNDEDALFEEFFPYEFSEAPMVCELLVVFSRNITAAESRMIALMSEGIPADAFWVYCDGKDQIEFIYSECPTIPEDKITHIVESMLTTDVHFEMSYLREVKNHKYEFPIMIYKEDVL